MKKWVKVVESLRESGLIKKGDSKKIKNKPKKKKKKNFKKEGFLSMLLGTLGVSLSGNISTAKAKKAKTTGWGVIRPGEQTIRASQDF